MRKLIFLLVLAVAVMVARAELTPTGVNARRLVTLSTNKPTQGDFRLVAAEAAADVCVDQGDFKVVSIAAGCFADDVERVTGRRPRIKTETRELSKHAVLIGTIGKCAVIDELIRAGKLDVKSVTGQWETFIIATVDQPVPGVDTALVIAGSDRRGTAFGVFELSESIGVSPWVWWADVVPQHQDTLTVRAGHSASRPPSVKYRGIFINDEDWGLQPWAAKTFEPEVGDIGPKTYAKVCELLLRLRANYLWPAMHPCTKAFNLYPQNKIVADNYAIVMGSSHCEQMLRNNVTEYDEHTLGPWDYDQNRTNILAYWQQRLEGNGKFENIYTIGMRGIHDSGMPGGGNTAQKVARLQRVIDDQRQLISQGINPDASKVPQIFCPYKEVLDLYQNGLRVPDDVTLVWPDDNHGYIRQLSNPKERKRSGGSGVYYHISYWGAPEDYLWLCTTPPALIWEEMRKAYDHGARNVWIANVGDIKPGEIGLEFFLRLAWDADAWDENAQLTFLTDWAARNFGSENAAEIASILDEYYLLNHVARPEHLHMVNFTANYNEAELRLQRFDKNVQRANAVWMKLPPDKRDACFQLVVYPVRASALANQMNLNPSPDLAQRAFEQLQLETKFYNDQMAGGKWRHMMSSNPRDRVSLRRPKPRTNAVSESVSISSDARARGYISLAAHHASRMTASDTTEWKTIHGMGRSGACIALQPSTVGVPDTAALEFDFATDQTNAAKIVVYCLPTQPIHPPMKLRYSVGIDAGEPMITDIRTAEYSKPWGTNVLRAAAIGSTEHALTAGRHTLKLCPLDPGLVIDKIVIELGGLQPSYLGPPETEPVATKNP